MHPGLIATLTELRDILLGTLPMNSVEILLRIPHPIPGYLDKSGTWIDAENWHVPDEKKVLSPDVMDPRYDSQKSDLLSRAVRELDTDYPGIKVAIVSLKNPLQPAMGQLKAIENSSGASTAKIAALYALHQLFYEMSKLAKEKDITDIATLQTEANALWSSHRSSHGFVQNSTKTRLPDLKTIFAFYDFSEATVPISTKVPPIPITDYFTHFDAVKKSPKLFFTKKILTILWPTTVAVRDTVGFSHGNSAGLLFRYLGFAYVGSVMLQSGLFRQDGPSGNGMWVRSDYQRRAPEWPASENPFPSRRISSRQNITAKSVADFFTLLSQRRLVNPLVSRKIIEVLGAGGCLHIFDQENLDRLNIDVVASKCGFTDEPIIHNDALLLHDPALLDFVVVVLTRSDSLSNKLEAKQASFFTKIRKMIAAI